MSAIVGSYEFIVYKTGSNYKTFRSNLSDETAGVIDIQTDFDTLWSNFKTTVGNNPASVSIRNGVYDYDTELTPPYSYCEITGENKYGTVLRPQGNISAFSTNNLGYFTLKNLRILTELGATHTKKVVKLSCNGISRSFFDLRDLTIDHIITSTRQQYGSAIGIELAGANPAVSFVTADNIQINGFQNAIEIDSTSQSPTGNVWTNENTFNRIMALHPYNFLKSNTGSGHDTHLYNFHECVFQTTFQDATTGNMFDIDDNAGAIHRYWTMDKCVMWDPFSTAKKFLKANTNCRVNITNSDPIDNRYMGGSGWDATNEKWNTGAYVKRSSVHNSISGYTTHSATGLQTDFGTSPNKIHQNADKCLILVQPISNDVKSIPYTLREDRSGNSFFVRFARPPRKGTNNVVIYWEVREL